jgi:hypothetical protein
LVVTSVIAAAAFDHRRHFRTLTTLPAIRRKIERWIECSEARAAQVNFRTRPRYFCRYSRS